MIYTITEFRIPHIAVVTQIQCEIWGSRSGDLEDPSFMGYLPVDTAYNSPRRV